MPSRCSGAGTRSPAPPPDPSADVYAIGAMLYQVLTGYAPYDGEHHPDGQAILAALKRTRRWGWPRRRPGWPRRDRPRRAR
jgi:serine/threonine protein kinase